MPVILLFILVYFLYLIICPANMRIWRVKKVSRVVLGSEDIYFYAQYVPAIFGIRLWWYVNLDGNSYFKTLESARVRIAQAKHKKPEEKVEYFKE